MADIRSGRMRHPIYCYVDTSGESDELPTWTLNSDLSDWPAEITDVQGVESFRGQRIESTTTHLITTRFDARITPHIRIYDPYRDRWFEPSKVIDKTGLERVLIIHATQLIERVIA